MQDPPVQQHQNFHTGACLGATRPAHATRPMSRAGTLLFFSALLGAATPAQITSASKGAGGGLCFVGPYGWTCDPDDFVTAVPTAGTVATTVPASYKAPVVLAAPKCAVSCVAGCMPPCPATCAEAKFKVSSEPSRSELGSRASSRTARSTWQPPTLSPCSTLSTRSMCVCRAAWAGVLRLTWRQQGTDGAKGTLDAPWASLGRALAQVRWLRNSNPAQLTTAGAGVLVWVREDPRVLSWNEWTTQAMP